MNANDILKLKDMSKLTDEEIRVAFPCLYATLVSLDSVIFNDYNPNTVAPPEMRLLKHSIQEDGYTQPVVVIKDGDQYIVVDGAHRYKTAKSLGLSHIPVTIIDRPPKDRVASTIRHNRARGEHNVTQMSTIVAELYKQGWTDVEISKNLGMGADEVLRLKQNTGIAEIFSDNDFSKSWE